MVRLGMLQLNPTAGALEGNAALIIRAARRAQALGANLMATSELALMGYLPPRIWNQERPGTGGRLIAEPCS